MPARLSGRPASTLPQGGEGNQHREKGERNGLHVPPVHRAPVVIQACSEKGGSEENTPDRKAVVKRRWYGGLGRLGVSRAGQQHQSDAAEYQEARQQKPGGDLFSEDDNATDRRE